MSLTFPLRIRVEKDVIVRIHRQMLGKGTISVNQNQEVTPTDILGSANISSGFRTLNLSQILSVHPSHVHKYLKILLGQKIYKGELLAFKGGGLFGGKTVVVSPTDGVLDFLNPKTGEIKMTFLPKKVDLTAGVYGIVEKIDKEKGLVIIRIQASLIHGIFGSGRARNGILHILGRRDELIGPHFYPAKLDGQILVGGSLIYKEAIGACISAGISGIITGGINARDYKGMAGGRLVFPKKLENDIGISVVVCEGFGSAPIGEDISELLSRFHGKFVSIDGNASIIILPSFERSSMNLVRNTKLPPEDDRIGVYQQIQQEAELKKGSYVRIIGNLFTGEQGKIVALDKTETVFPSGIKTFVATVETRRRKLQVPVANLEIIL